MDYTFSVSGCRGHRSDGTFISSILAGISMEFLNKQNKNKMEPVTGGERIVPVTGVVDVRPETGGI